MDWIAPSYLLPLGVGIWVGYRVGRDTIGERLKAAQERELAESAQLTDQEVDARFKAKIDDLQRCWNDIRSLRAAALEQLRPSPSI